MDGGQRACQYKEKSKSIKLTAISAALLMA